MTDSTAADSIAAGSTAAAALVADSSDCDYSCPTDDYHQTLGKSRRSHRDVDADSMLVRDHCERNSKRKLTCRPCDIAATGLASEQSE